MNGTWQASRVLLDAEVQASDAATKTLKLPSANYLHTLYVKAKITNGATSAHNLSMQDVIDSIKVIANGSDVLYSLTVQEIKRWAAWFTGYNVPQNRTEVAGAVQEIVLPIFFGRGPYDPNFYLPCARLSDLELKVEYSPTIGAVGFVTGTFTLSVVGLYSMGNPPGEYLGTLSHKTVRAFQSAAAGDEQTLIPRGNILRNLMVYAYEAAIEDGVDITRVKFDLNNLERVMYDVAWNDQQDINAIENWICYREQIRALVADTETLDTKVARIRGKSTSEHVQSSIANDTFDFVRAHTIAGDRLTFEVAEADITPGLETYVTQATPQQVFVEVESEVLPHAVVLDFAKAGEQSAMNTSDFDQVRVTLTQGGAGADVRISTQEIRYIGQ